MAKPGSFSAAARRLRGELLRTLREQAGLTQQQVAQAARLERADISRLEHGKRALEIEEAERLVDVLRCSLEDLRDQVRIPQWAKRVRRRSSYAAYRHAVREELAGNTPTPARALGSALKMQALAQTPFERGMAWNNQAVCLWMLGHLGAAARRLHLARRTAPLLDPELRANLYYNLAIVHRKQGDLDGARTYALQAAEAWATWPEPRKETEQRQRLRVGMSIKHIEGNVRSTLYELAAPIQRSEEEWAAARESFLQARRIAEAQDLRALAVTITNNLGLHYALAERWQEAEGELELSLAAARRLGYPRALVHALVETGRCARWQGKDAAASRAFTEALSLTEESAFPDHRFHIYFHLGALAWEQRDREAAEDYEDQLKATRPSVTVLTREVQAYDTRPPKRKRSANTHPHTKGT